VRCKGLVVGHHGVGLLPPFDVEIRPGEVVLVVGRNGSGKSTFVRTVLGLQRPVGGELWRDPEIAMAYVPQASALDAIVPVRAADVVGWGRMRRWDFVKPWRRHGDAAACAGAMTELGVAELARRRLAELSGGQAQRVMLSRLIAGEAKLAVLDEPTAAMDARGERATYARLRTIAHARGVGVLVVTHAVAVAARYADRIVFFDPDTEEGGRVDVGRTSEVSVHAGFQALFGDVHAGDEAVSAG
jgi:zinc transport system ATP-binding protein